VTPKAQISIALVIPRRGVDRVGLDNESVEKALCQSSEMTSGA